jgi:hypothetical protein
MAVASGINTISEEEMTNTTMTVVEQRIREYDRFHGKLPDDLNNLPVFPNRGKELQDGWGRPLQYIKDGQRKFRLVSLGADDKLGGSGESADIVQVVEIFEWQ